MQLFIRQITPATAQCNLIDSKHSHLISILSQSELEGLIERDPYNYLQHVNGT